MIIFASLWVGCSESADPSGSAEAVLDASEVQGDAMSPATDTGSEGADSIEPKDDIVSPASDIEEEPAGDAASIDPDGTTDASVAGPPQAIVKADRSGHWLDRPFPSEELMSNDGRTDWSILPPAPGALGAAMVGGWGAQASEASFGTGHQPAIYFQFSSSFEVSANQIGLVDSSGKEIPLEWSWVTDPMGDPYFVPNTLILMPEHTSPLTSGERYVAWVSAEVADPADGWEPPEGCPDNVAVATSFRVQDSLGQLQQMAAKVAEYTLNAPETLQVHYLKKATSLTYSQGETASGNPSTLATVIFEDGTESVTYLAPNAGNPILSVDLSEDWPFDVWEAEITTFAFQVPSENKPWSSPGAGLIADFVLLHEGWIPFVDGQLSVSPVTESMRIVIQVPKDTEETLPVLLWDHGTGGHAYNAVARASWGDAFAEVAESISKAVVVSRDQPLYGQRYPLIDEGFGASLGFYNIGNLPAFRDNQRQAALDHLVLQRFVQQELPGIVSSLGKTVDPARMGAFGHSLGSVTLHSALASQIAAGNGVKSAFMSGAGGYLTYYILGTGLLGTGSSLVNSLAPILGFSIEEVTEFEPHELIAAIVGLPPESWERMDRSHPVLQIFATIMDPSDPLMLAKDQTVPEVILMGIDDWQVPNKTTQWLAEVHPFATLIPCQKQDDYDGHFCTFREPEGLQALQDFVNAL